jgi:cell division protein ZapE
VTPEPEAVSAGVGPPFVPFDPAQAEAARLLADLHRRLAATPPIPRPTGWVGRLRARFSTPLQPVTGLYLWGGVGRGKTHLMDWFADLPLPGKRRVHFHHFMREVHQELAGLPRQPDPLEVLAERRSREHRVLCLDEFVVTDITDAMLLYGLLRALFTRGVTLVTTSNAAPRTLYRNGLQRDRFLPAIDLLEHHTRVHELTGGPDYRLRALTAAGVWFVTGETDADATLAECFERLAGGHEERTPVMAVNGREVPVRRLASNVGWFEFDVLCGGPRATADYIEIARELGTLILSGVPVLTPARDAAARRFLHLVDELYDRRVKLIVSAQAPPAGLVTGELRDFPGERLVSRLTEMQSREYLAAAG